MMRLLNRSAVLPILLCLILAACGGNSSQDTSKDEPAKPQSAQQQQAAPAPAPTPAAEPAAAKAPESKTATPAKAAADAAKKLLPKDVVILKGSPMGGVKFEHKLHTERAANKCETCHHASKPEKPAAAPQQACSTCHTTVAAAPMKTKLQAAFHTPTATAGTCIDCHKTQNAAGKAAPTKCLDCHKKTNI